MKSAGIGFVSRVTHMVVGLIRMTFVLTEGWTKEPHGSSESQIRLDYENSRKQTVLARLYN